MRSIDEFSSEQEARLLGDYLYAKGIGNDVDEDTCLNACTQARCGDGVVGPGEGCDDGCDNPLEACNA